MKPLLANTSQTNISINFDTPIPRVWTPFYLNKFEPTIYIKLKNSYFPGMKPLLSKHIPTLHLYKIKHYYLPGMKPP